MRQKPAKKQKSRPRKSSRSNSRSERKKAANLRSRENAKKVDKEPDAADTNGYTKRRTASKLEMRA